VLQFQCHALSKYASNVREAFSSSEEPFYNSNPCPPGKTMNSTTGVCEGFEDLQNAISNGMNMSGGMNSGAPDVANISGNPNVDSMEGPANFGSVGAPAGCYPRDQVTPGELLPKDQNSVWAEQNPMGPGSGRHRIHRGGNYRCGEESLKISKRFRDIPEYASDGIGFRLARTII
jgi:hypothetical protein